MKIFKTLIASALCYIILFSSVGADYTVPATWKLSPDKTKIYVINESVEEACNMSGGVVNNCLPFLGGGGGAVSSVNGQSGTVVLNLDDINDVDLIDVEAGQLLQYDGLQWVAGSASGVSVSSVFARTGAVVAVDGDLDQAKITG